MALLFFGKTHLVFCNYVCPESNSEHIKSNAALVPFRLLLTQKSEYLVLGQVYLCGSTTCFSDVA